MSLKVKLWGVRGSIACPSPHFIQYGGNTSCLEVTAGDQKIILDAGTGIRELGNDLKKHGVSKATLLLTHTHWDHINGFPFFLPAYQEKNEFRILAGHLSKETGGIKNALAGQMTDPMFPVPLAAMKSKMVFEDFKAGDEFKLGKDIRVQTRPLAHPNGATGYRIEYKGSVFSYITDTEHEIGESDSNVLSLMQDADLVVYDSTYTDEEFETYKGWGHSTWQEGIRLCKKANVKKLGIFHHDPNHDDEFMSKVESQAKRAWEHAIVTREGMTFSL